MEKRVNNRSDSGLRSVVDYANEEALRRAMGNPLDPHIDCGVGSNDDDGNSDHKMDWVTSNIDLETSEVQSMQQELQRLMDLKSYLILDAEREEAFERITALAARIYNVPMALVSLVDLGRQWFMSNRGLGDTRETPRSLAFCAHTILSKRDCMVVPDATKDFRFQDNPFVTGPAHIRFYAGAPLISPEGYKLGTFCLVDKTERPGGLSEDEIATLRDLADMTVKVMVDRRFQLQSREDPTHLIAQTAHDLLTPLTGVQLSLSLLHEDSDVKEKLSPPQWELLTTATSCSDLMIRICQTSVQSLRTDSAASANGSNQRNKKIESVPIATMKELVRNLAMIMDPIPKHVPIIITLDPEVPDRIISDDLKLFRSCLNLLTIATARTRSGKVHLKIYVKSMEGVQVGASRLEKVVFECEDTGQDINSDDYQHLYQPSGAEDGETRLGLSSVATLISSLDGEYGFRPRGIATDGSDVMDSRLRRVQGSVFWFSVPLYPISDLDHFSEGRISSSSLKALAPLTTSRGALRRKTPIIPSEVLIRTSSSISVASNGKGRLPMFSPDVCMNAVFELPMEQTAGTHMQMSDNAYTRRKRSQGQQRFATESIPLRRQDSAPRTRCVLIIEDSIIVRKCLANALAKLGFLVTQAVNGMEGLRELKAELFDLVLCDFLMPVMDGLDCVKQYRAWEKENRPLYRQYIVGISAHVSVEDSVQGIEAGMDDFKPKPITIKYLTELQESDPVLARSKQLDELMEIEDTDNLADSDDLEGRVAGAVSVGASTTEGSDVVPAKRHRPGSESLQTGPACLLAIDYSKQERILSPRRLEAMGMRLITANDSQGALQLLETRNWDLVLIDEDLVRMVGSSLIQRFRQWEEENRVNRQRNLFLLIQGEIPAPWDQSSIIQAPSGFDGILKFPIVWEEFEYLIRKIEKSDVLDIVVNKR